MNNNTFLFILRGVKSWCYERPRHLFCLPRNKHLYCGPSFYADEKHKSTIKSFMDQVWQIYKYGEPELFYFMYGLDTKSGKEYHSYVNYRTFLYRRNYLNFETHIWNNSCCLLRNKFYFGLICNELNIPSPRNLFYLSEGLLYRTDSGMGMRNAVPFSDLLLLDDIQLFCKRVNGECGCDVFQLDIRDHDLFLNKTLISVGQLEQSLKGADFIFQEKVIQHEELARLNPQSLNTIRLTTVRNLKSGEIKIWPSALRIGIHGNYVDNLSQGGVIVGFDLLTGRLNQYGFQRPEFGGRSEKHPDSCIRYSDFVIPFFKEAKELAVYFHSKLKDVHSIGWDIAITESGPMFIEGNDNWEITVSQAANYGMLKLFEEDFY